MKERPLLVVLTPVLNEAWILPAFLKATSLWADYIIIADQMSTDGSREVYDDFASQEPRVKCQEHQCKLIVVDNPRKEMHQAATRRLLFEEAKKIEGDKILFALDADEFLSGNFLETDSWKIILNSEPGDLFCFRWMTLSSDGKTYTPWDPYCWAAHMSDEVMNGIFPDNFIHEWRLPWPKHVTHEYILEDISFIHFRNVNVARQRNKSRYYQVLQYSHLSNKRGGVQFHRQYNLEEKAAFYPMPSDAFAFYKGEGLDIWAELNFKDEGQHYTQVVLNKIKEVGAKSLRKLDIWDEEFLQKNNIKDPRRPVDKLIHWYLRSTAKWSKTFVIHALDYILKRIY